jgi:type II secretory pathway pseudopilin PulG
VASDENPLSVDDEIAQLKGGYERNRRRSERALITSIVGLLIIVLAATILVVTLNRQTDIRDSITQTRDSQRQQACIARITAEFQGAVGDALLAPPAPNAARTNAVDRIQTAANKLEHLDRYCP